MKNILWLFSILLLILFSSCDPVEVLKDTKNTDTLDYVWDETKVVKIAFQDNSIAVNNKNVQVAGRVLTIIGSGTYELSGTLTEGQVVVNSSGVVRLLMNNVNISNSTTAPIFIKDAKRAILILPEGTHSTVTDGAEYVLTADSLNSAIYSTDYMAITGQGALTVNGNYNSAISSRDELIIESGSFVVNAAGPAIKGRDYLIINGGDFKINSGGDAIKSDKELVANQGFVEINAGTFHIVSQKDGITAITDLRINAGSFDITTGGGSTAVPDSTISAKGLKSDNSIEINGGSFKLSSSDHAISASNKLIIHAGDFNINSVGDAIKSNAKSLTHLGLIEIHGGTFHIVSQKDGFTALTDLKITAGDFDITTGGGSTMERDTTISAKAIKCGDRIEISGGAFKLNSSDNAIDASNHLFLNAGEFQLSSSNKPLDSDSTLTIRSAKVDIIKAMKGVSSHKIYLLGGVLTVNSQNDCLKASKRQDIDVNDGSSIVIDGAELYLDTQKGDALDSNGSITINSGVVVVQGSSSSKDDALKYRESFTINGGVVVASGGNSLLPNKATELVTVGIKFRSLIVPGMIINIQDEAGNTVISYKSDKLAYYMVIAHKDLKLNTKYNLYIGGSVEGAEINGYYPQGLYTPGNKKGSFTLTLNNSQVTV